MTSLTEKMYFDADVVFRFIYLFYIILLMTVFSSNTFAQSIFTEKERDSILAQLVIEKNDTTKVKLLDDLAWELRKQDTSSAREYAEQGLELANKIDYSAGQSNHWNRLGNILEFRGYYLKAIDYYQNSLQIEIEQKDSIKIGRAYHQISICYKKQSEFDKALEFGLKSSSILEQSASKSRRLTIAYSNIGTIYKHLGQYEEAIEIYSKSERLRESRGEPRLVGLVKMSLGNLFLEMKHYDKALGYYNESLIILKESGTIHDLAEIQLNLGACHYQQKNYGTALEYYEKVLEVKDLTEPEITGLLLNNLVSIYKIQENYILAKRYCLESLVIWQKLGNKKGIAATNHNLGIISNFEESPNMALNYLQKSLLVTKEMNDLPLSMEVYRDLSSTYQVLKQPEKALEYLTKYNHCKDTLFDNYRKAIDYKLKYEEEVNKNQLLEKDSQIQIAKTEKRFTILTSATLIVSLLFFSLFFLYRSKQKQKLAAEKEKLALQKVDTLLNEQEIKTSYAKLEGQEIEKKRIAQDLHDRLGSMLATVKLYFKSVDAKIDSLKEENKNQYNKAQELLDEACEEVRKIAHNLISGTLKNFGIVEELESLVETIQESQQIKIELFTFGLTERLDLNLEINIYRIIQELISNILKHSKATEVTIQLNKHETNLNVLVEDNGIGFDPGSIKIKKGMGLKNIEARIFQRNGILNIDSGKGGGTTISIDLPIQKD